nr:tetratricopeptide repeat protein [Desulfobacter curvatus]
MLRGKLHIVLKKYKEAKEDFNEAIRLFPNSQIAHQLLRASEKYLSQADE